MYVQESDRKLEVINSWNYDQYKRQTGKQIVPISNLYLEHVLKTLMVNSLEACVLGIVSNSRHCQLQNFYTHIKSYKQIATFKPIPFSRFSAEPMIERYK